MKKNPDLNSLYKNVHRYSVGKRSDQRSKFVPIDILTCVAESKHVLLSDRSSFSSGRSMKIRQIALLLCSLRKLYGVGAEFLVDASCPPILAMIISLRHLDNAFFKKFKVEGQSKYVGGITKRLAEIIS